MKRKRIFLNTFLIILLLNFPSICRAEKIYCKDGRVLNEAILYRSRGSVWIKTNLGTAGISVGDIVKIENDDGSISKYDYSSVSRALIGFIAQQKYAEAEILCVILLEAFPSDAQIHYLRGLLNQKIGNFELALEDYNFLLKRGINSPEVFNNLGAIYARKKDSNLARDFFIKAIRYNPDIAEVHNNLANLLLEIKDYPAAIEEYNKVVKKEPDNTLALYNLGACYMYNKDYLKAKEAWQKVLDLKPFDKEAKNALEYLKTVE